MRVDVHAPMSMIDAPPRMTSRNSYPQSFMHTLELRSTMGAESKLGGLCLSRRHGLVAFG